MTFQILKLIMWTLQYPTMQQPAAAAVVRVLAPIVAVVVVIVTVAVIDSIRILTHY